MIVEFVAILVTTAFAEGMKHYACEMESIQYLE